jgi:SagB-type dehydrogenase family enzyme
LRAPGTKKGRRVAPPAISARLGSHVTLEARAEGKLVACFEGFAIGLGTLSASATDRAQALRAGLPLASFASSGEKVDQEIDLLVRRLARHGLLEYRLPSAQHREDHVVIEPQVANYWPETPPLGDADVLVLSRFAYLRRRGSEMVLESPRAGALFKICDPKIASALATLSTPHPIAQLRREEDFPGLELLALLVGCQILLKIDRADDTGLRPAEGDHDLVLWDFHDLLFHTRATQGRHANPLGGIVPYAGLISPLPALRPSWPGQRIDLDKISDAEANSPIARLLRERHSTRSFDAKRPITLAELSLFLGDTARVLSKWEAPVDVDDAGPIVEYAARPYPSAGASYALELYLAVDQCDGLARGFYHYEAGTHALVKIDVHANELDAHFGGAEFAMGAPDKPQILITIAARFGRMSWKYSSIAYALILKDVGVLTQTLYLMATDMGLGGCAIGSVNIDLFAKLTGIEFHVEGAVGQFALGRGATSAVSDQH